MLLSLICNLEVFPKGRRRGRSRPRIDAELDKKRLEELQKEYEREIILQAEEASSLRTDYEIAKYMMQGEDRKIRLQALEKKAIEAENYMNLLLDEEAFILILALAV